MYVESEKGDISIIWQLSLAYIFCSASPRQNSTYIIHYTPLQALLKQLKIYASISHILYLIKTKTKSCSNPFPSFSSLPNSGKKSIFYSSHPLPLPNHTSPSPTPPISPSLFSLLLSKYTTNCVLYISPIIPSHSPFPAHTIIPPGSISFLLRLRII